MKYPDISHYHPVLSWTKTKESCGFLISKATQGTGYVDPTLGSFIKGCEENHIPYWLYTFLNKGNEKAQAEFMVKTCKDKVGKYFMGYVLDVEQKNDAANVKIALDYIKTKSAKTMIYTMYADYAKYKSVIASRGDNCAWWEARYGRNNGSYSILYPCHKGVDLHQYTSNGKCNGISGRTDLNRLTGTKNLAWFTEVSKKAEEKPSTNGIAVDGSWGVETTKKAQTVFKTTVDGKVSRQPMKNAKYLTACSLKSWQFWETQRWYKGGSELIKAMQKKLGVEQDGYFGQVSIKALQKFLGVSRDGKCGENTVKAFQKWLNKQ